MSIEIDNSDLFAPKDTMSRVSIQLSVLTLLEPVIGATGKITMTPTRIKIMSSYKEGTTFNNQQAQVVKVVRRFGSLPFTVELVPHG